MQAGPIIFEIDREIERLQQARSLLAGTKRRGRRPSAAPPASTTDERQSLSTKGRRVISKKSKVRRVGLKKRAAAAS